MSRAIHRHLFIGVVCGLLVVTGLGALWWGQQHQYRQPSTTSSAAGRQPQDASGAAPPPSSGNAAGRGSVAAPVSVMLPKLRLDERLVRLGLDSSGAIRVPSGNDVQRVAWFDGSPRPGQPGPAVIEGHVVTPGGEGPFHALSTLTVGDRATVRDAAGRQHTFTVYRVARYPKNRFPTQEVYANTSGAELRLITCSGTFDTRTGHYDSNTVVYAR